MFRPFMAKSAQQIIPVLTDSNDKKLLYQEKRDQKTAQILTVQQHFVLWFGTVRVPGQSPTS